jgi:hypothetical protein
MYYKKKIFESIGLKQKFILKNYLFGKRVKLPIPSESISSESLE